MLYASQIRAARALLGWRQEELSKAAGVGAATIHRIEKGSGPVLGNVSTVLKIQAAFEQAGIQFIDEDEAGGFGLRMAKRKRRR
jgi:transcriptional regulator with XRE-family HTH domain